jgi:uncharacterized protein YbjT (DUF2867 family)
MKVVVIGGTGLIGSEVVPKLNGLGHDATPASPSSGVNALTGEGLADVFQGAAVVVDVSNSPSFADADVLEFFEVSTNHILDVASLAGVEHLVALSVVGAERLTDSGYLRAKVAQEDLIKASIIPYTLIRATQFFEFIMAIADQATTDDGTVHLPGVGFQPVASRDVAQAVAEIAVSSPLMGSVELAGPELFRFDELVLRELRARGDNRPVEPDPRARYFGTELSERSLVPGDGARLGSTHYEDWLARSRNGR